MKKLGFILPVYNVEKYLEDCVNSLINQSTKDIEILLIDDGSTDNSGTICDNLAKQYDIGIYSMTQLNGTEKTADIIDVSCVSGGKAIQNKLDAGCISLYPRKKEQKFTEGLLQHWLSENKRGKFGEDFKPNVVLHNYKVRFSKYGIGIKLYQYLDKGTGRCIDLYCTDLYDNPINIDKTIVE